MNDNWFERFMLIIIATFAVAIWILILMIIGMLLSGV